MPVRIRSQGLQIDKAVLEDLISKRLTIDQISTTLKISAATIRRRLAAFDLRTNPIQSFHNNGICGCKKCGNNDKEHFYRRRNGKLRTDLCKKCFCQRTVRRSIINKIKLVKHFGCICNGCGFKTKFLSVYDFHHPDRALKSSAPSKLLRYSWKRIIAELGKCIMLCANCHRIEHEGISNRGQIATKQSRSIIDGLRRRRLEIIQYFGGACLDCGLRSVHNVYDCHHLNPSIKSLTLRDMKKLKLVYIESELMNCILLCANCHRVRHNSVELVLEDQA